jgi:hypothetical protein
MWKMLLFLWLIPIILGLVAVKRVADGRRVISKKELRFVFGGSQHAGLSLWFWLALAMMAIGFFTLGVVQAVVLLGGVFWAAIAPLLSATILTLLLILLMRNRFSYRKMRRAARQPAQRRSITYSRDF